MGDHLLQILYIFYQEGHGARRNRPLGLCGRNRMMCIMYQLQKFQNKNSEQIRCASYDDDAFENMLSRRKFVVVEAKEKLDGRRRERISQLMLSKRIATLNCS